MRAYICAITLIFSPSAHAAGPDDSDRDSGGFTIEQARIVDNVICVATLNQNTIFGDYKHRVILRDLKDATASECLNALTSEKPIVVRENVDYAEAAEILDIIDRCLRRESNGGEQECSEMSRIEKEQISTLLRSKMISSIDYSYNTFRPWSLFLCENHELGGVTGCSVVSFGIKEGKFSDIGITRIVD